MPPCQPVKPGARLDRGAQPRHLLARDLRHRHALHDEVGPGHLVGVGVDLRATPRPGRRSRRLEERDEQLGGLDRLMALPPAADHQSLRRHGQLPRNHSSLALRRPTACPAVGAPTPAHHRRTVEAEPHEVNYRQSHRGPFRFGPARETAHLARAAQHGDARPSGTEGRSPGPVRKSPRATAVGRPPQLPAPSISARGRSGDAVSDRRSPVGGQEGRADTSRRRRPPAPGGRPTRPP